MNNSCIHLKWFQNIIKEKQIKFAKHTNLQKKCENRITKIFIFNPYIFSKIRKSVNIFVFFIKHSTFAYGFALDFVMKLSLKIKLIKEFLKHNPVNKNKHKQRCA